MSKRNFFSAPIKSICKHQKNKMCRNEFKGNNHFGSRNFTNEIWALETPETRKSSKGLSVTLCVKVFSSVVLAVKIKVGNMCNKKSALEPTYNFN